MVREARIDYPDWPGVGLRGARCQCIPGIDDSSPIGMCVYTTFISHARSLRFQRCDPALLLAKVRVALRFAALRVARLRVDALCI